MACARPSVCRKRRSNEGTLPPAALPPLVTVGCDRNTALGYDREAQLDPAPTPAPIAPAPVALANVAPEVVKPEVMSTADTAALGGREGRYAFRLTEVGFPAFLFEPGGSGAIKLNGTLIPVGAAGPGRFASGDLLVTTRSLDEEGSAGLQVMELVVVPPQAKDELGYRGYIK